MPDMVRGSFSAPLPRTPKPLEEIYASVAENVLGYPMGNVLPPFGPGICARTTLPVCLVLAAEQGSNVGGRNHAAVRKDQ